MDYSNPEITAVGEKKEIARRVYWDNIISILFYRGQTPFIGDLVIAIDNWLFDLRKEGTKVSAL